MIERNESSMLKTGGGGRSSGIWKRKEVNLEMKGIEKKGMWVALGKKKKDSEEERKRKFLREVSQFG